MHRKVLGRGLEALIPTSAGAASAGTATVERPAGVREIPVTDIGPNPFQPRKRFDDQAIQELAASIKVSGVLQPVLVRRDGENGYQLVAGERRLRASILAGLDRIPALEKTIDDREMMDFLAEVGRKEKEKVAAKKVAVKKTALKKTSK